MSKIALLGLGAMGSRMAKRLIEAGHSLTVYNRNSEKAEPLLKIGANFAGTPASAVLGAEFVFSMVTDDEAAREVWLNHQNPAISGVSSAQVVLECSTISPGWAKEVAAAVERKSGHFIECPVAGSRPQAEAGKLICFFGGKASVAEKVTEILKPLAEATHLVGDVGSGAVFRLLANGYFLAQIAALKEVMDVAERAGLKTKQVNEIFQTLPATSPALKGILQPVAAGNTDPRFTAALVEKDLRYLIDLSLELNAHEGIFRETHKYFQKAVNDGKGDKNASVVIVD